MKTCAGFFSLLILFFSCSPNNVTVDDSLEKYFKEAGVEGCFALWDNGTNEFTLYNKARFRDSAYLPASTFKIVNSLIGCKPASSAATAWSSSGRHSTPVADWNKDLNMYQAFRLSSVAYYQEVARRIGQDTMQRWLDSLAYGTKKIKSRVDSFWLDNTLKIRPDEQLGLVKKLYFTQLPFHKYNQEIVKRHAFEDKPAYRLSYKTGLGYKENGLPIGWIVGWIEENKHPYFFVLNIEGKDRNTELINSRFKLLKNILRHLNYMQGKG